MSIMKNINDDTSLDACKVPTKLEVGGKSSAESILSSDNADSESNNDCETDI